MSEFIGWQCLRDHTPQDWPHFSPWAPWGVLATSDHHVVLVDHAVDADGAEGELDRCALPWPLECQGTSCRSWRR
jgi:hypothetical protein